MSLRRVGWLAATALATCLWMSCGQVYRPVVIPVNPTPPNPANFHTVLGISSNVAANPGTVLQVDVSGDSNIGVANMGVNPTHVAGLPNNSRFFVASAGSANMTAADIITGFVPAQPSVIATGISNIVTFSMPNVGPNQTSAITAISESSNVVTVTLQSPIGQATVGGPIIISGVSIGGYDGNFVISSVNGTTIQYVDPALGLAPANSGTAMVPLPTFCSYQPDYVTTTQSNAVYVANYGQENGPTCSLASTDSIAALNTTSNTVGNIAYLPAGSHPVAMVETPNAQNLYVVNQGDGQTASTVVDISPVDLSTIATIPVGINPTWIVARLNGQRVYVLTQGNGQRRIPSQLYTIDTTTNTVLSTQALGVGASGAGANYVLYDKNLDRLYVPNPNSGSVYVFSATTDPPTLLGGAPLTIPIPPASPCASATAGCGPVVPSAVAALPDGSRFYVASYQTQSPCSDPNAGTGTCVIPFVTVYDAPSLTVKQLATSTFAPQLALFTTPFPFATGQYAVPEVASCVPLTVYKPGTTRFRIFATAAADSSHVYVSICDAGAIADISTTTNTLNQGTNSPDTLVIDLLAPFSAAAPGSNNEPPPQNPLFLLTGQ
ncbi:MAG TPA: hypothetical protein VE377_17610 [Candidatus Dormibacteraeota bacterium]|nr:hypothetical protein [Candidatus Dormibacteraeota bacterium]